MDVEQLVELRLRRLAECGHLAVSGIVDQMVEGVAVPCRAQGRADTLDEAGDLGDVADIELQRDRPAAHGFDLGHDGLRALGAVAIGQDHVAAMARDADGGVAAKTTVAACHD